MQVQINKAVRDRFPDLYYKQAILNNLDVQKSSFAIEQEKIMLISEWKNERSEKELRTHRNIYAYKNYYHEIGLEPSKNPPAIETLILRCVLKGFFPNINNVVDACNVASVKYLLSMAVFDADKFVGVPQLRFSEIGEKFQPIGRQDQEDIDGGLVILADQAKVISIFSYKDSDLTKIALSTRNILLIGCHVDGIEDSELNDAMDLTQRLINDTARLH